MSLARRLHDYFPRLLRARGERYFADGRVLITKMERARIEAEVRCTITYRVAIAFQSNHRIDAFCECERFQAKDACKHIWAVVLAVDDSAPAAPSARRPARATSRATLTGGETTDGGLAPAENFLTTGQAARSAAASALTPEIHYLLDLTQARARGTPLVELASWSAGAASRGGGRRALRVRRQQLHALADPLDRRVLGFLFGVELDGIRLPPGRAAAAAALMECSAFVLRNLDAREFLPFLCATRRFFLRVAGNVRAAPVSWDAGDPWQFGVDLSSSASDGGQELRGYFVRGEARIPIAKTELCLSGVFIAGNEGCAFEDRVAEGWREKLILAEPQLLSIAERDKLITHCVEREPLTPVDLPAEWRQRAEPQIAPQPILVLDGEGSEPDRADTVLCRLHFNYGARRIPMNHPGTRLVDRESSLILTRAPSLEREAFERLVALGALRDENSAEPSSTYFRFAGARLAALASTLRSEGWKVEHGSRPYRGVGQVHLQVHAGIDWFDIEGAVDFDGEAVPLATVLDGLRKGGARVRLADGSYAALPEEWLPRLRLLGLLATRKREHLQCARGQAWALGAILDGMEGVTQDAATSERFLVTAAAPGVDEACEGESFHGELREYQRHGLRWLRFLQKNGLGGCLADDMGLGKTVQVLAMLDSERSAGAAQPSLVVAPKSVVYNWVEEAKRFVPELTVVDFTGVRRGEAWQRISECNLVVTSYGVLRRDLARLAEVEFNYVILDESQAIKNLASLTARSARGLRSRHRLALSGTPIENHLVELWSLFEFLNPGMLGTSQAFRAVFRNRVPDDRERGFLAAALRPVLLRRTKEQVARELPAKTEQIVYCRMDESQRRRYRDLSRSFRAALLSRIDQHGMDRARIHILEALLRLRQAACHPGLLDEARVDDASCKLEFLLPQLEEIVEEGHKALVFSQFTSFLAILRRRLARTRLTYEYLDGSTRNRQACVDRFQQDADCGLFLISLKAGGLGINLTAADYVFILDPWWNPAVEAQAIDRTHRIGQTRRVFAYRLITQETVEEKILRLKERKQALADSILGADAGFLSDLTRQDLETLLS